MPNPSNNAARIATVAVLFIAAAVGAYALYSIDSNDAGECELPPSCTLDLKDQLAVDPSLVRFTQSSQIAVPLKKLRAVAVGPKDRIYVAGDQAVHIFLTDGSPHTVIQTKGDPRCLAVGGKAHVVPGRLYVGTEKDIEVFSPSGEAVSVWPLEDDKTLLTSIAVAVDAVYVADAGNKVVLRYDKDGKLVASIGRANPDREMPGFIVPSPYFDVAVSPIGELHIVNPGARRVQMYTPDGELGGYWGKAGAEIEGFFGCCNPAHLAILSDGRFVTSEKGIPRIKVYDILGDFESVVAGTKELGISESAAGDARANKDNRIFDIAADSFGRVLVLDRAKKRIRVFSPIQATDEPGAPK